MPDEQPTALDLVHQAIATGVFGQIQWDDRADERARSNPDLRGLTPEGIRRLLHALVRGGGKLDERRRSEPTGWKRTRISPPIIATTDIAPWCPYRTFSRVVCSSKSAYSTTIPRTPGSKS